MIWFVIKVLNEGLWGVMLVYIMRNDNRILNNHFWLLKFSMVQKFSLAVLALSFHVEALCLPEVSMILGRLLMGLKVIIGLRDGQRIRFNLVVLGVVHFRRHDFAILV